MAATYCRLLVVLLPGLWATMFAFNKPLGSRLSWYLTGEKAEQHGMNDYYDFRKYTLQYTRALL